MELDRRDRTLGDVSREGLGERRGDIDGRRKCKGTAVGDPSKREGDTERLRLLLRLDTVIGNSSSIWTEDRE